MWFNRRRDPRVRDEISFHRDRLIEDYIAAGMDRADAERRAFLEFGNAVQIEESVLDARGQWLEDSGVTPLRLARWPTAVSPQGCTSLRGHLATPPFSV